LKHKHYRTYKGRLISPEGTILVKSRFSGSALDTRMFSYEYSNKEMGANKKEGHVKLERSPVKEAKVFKNDEKLPC
jgi:hypothetical protein